MTNQQSFIARKVLICGSRHATAYMLAVTRFEVERQTKLGNSILVGEAAGVDETVIQACADQGVPFECFGISEEPRHWYAALTPKQATLGTYMVISGDYIDRDNHMVRLADFVVCIWNGFSRGTRNIHYTAIHAGKPSNMQNFGTSRLNTSTGTNGAAREP